MCNSNKHFRFGGGIMFILGTTLALGKYTADETSTHVPNITDIKIQEGIYDHLFGTTYFEEENYFTNDIPEWDYYTFISASFNNTLFGGNVDFSLETTDSIRIKRRVKGSYNWLTLTSIPITKEADFSFIYYDNLNSAKVTYEYALVPTKAGTEGMMTISEVYSDFDGLYIVGNDKVYFGFLNLTYPTPIRKKPSAINTPLDSQFPTIVNNSKANYYTDSCSATFVDTEEDSEWGWNFEDGWKYRDDFKDWLYNGKAKVIKYYTGRTWLVGISGDIVDKVNGVEENTITTFTWYQVGKAESGADLMIHGLIEAVGGQ